jgi:S1-C subfamily serine protease
VYVKKLLLAVVAVALTACSTIPNYRSLASKVVPTNVELIGDFYNLWTGETRPDAAYCSGVVVSPTRVITAAHCTEAAKTIPVQQGVAIFDGKIKLRLGNGKVVLAKILVSNFKEEGGVLARDVALLEVEEGGLGKVADLGDSDSVAVGDQVAIVGNTFGELKHSFTIGVVSYIHRQLPVGNFFQTDALSGGGNSGGPVFDMNGKVVGILTRGGGGVSLFIPINEVVTQLAEALRNGKQERAHGTEATNQGS